MFCSPSNPTGSVYSEEQVKAIGEWALAHGIWVITDEIYEHLLYDGAKAPSMPVLVPGLADQCIILNGVAKTYAMTGWRVGWMIGPADVIAAATNLQSQITSNVANVSQRAALAAVSGDLTAVDEMRSAFDRRRRTMVEMLNAETAQRSEEPPAKVLYNAINPPLFCDPLKCSAKASPSMPGKRTNPNSCATANKPKVK